MMILYIFSYKYSDSSISHRDLADLRLEAVSHSLPIIKSEMI